MNLQTVNLFACVWAKFSVNMTGFILEQITSGYRGYRI